MKIRARACSKGDGSCSGDPTETNDCLVAECPDPNVKGITSQYQQWEEWSKCSTSCGKGSKIRARACSGSRGSCSGEPSEIRDCLEEECIRSKDKSTIKSQWQGWGEWSHCSISCGNGARIRARACSGSHGSCSAEWTETKDCLLDKCPVIKGKWQEWGAWAQCSTTCGKGAQIRARACSKNDGSCPGEPTETKGCLVAECPGFPFCSITCFDFTSFQDLPKQLQFHRHHQPHIRQRL